MRDWVERIWYAAERPPWFLRGLARLFGWLAQRRRRRYQKTGRAYRSSLPVIVVGNISIGGTGKSPLTAHLVSRLRAQGLRPVILSRGYGGHAAEYPLRVDVDTPVAQAGDEPLMLARLTAAPVVVDPDRARGARWIEAHALGDIILCDDGLQHYRLMRDVELVVMDSVRGVGNGALLPAGPLREPLPRLNEAQAVILNGDGTWRPPPGVPVLRMHLVPARLRHLVSGETRPLDWLQGQIVDAVAGIGHPQRFFDTLTALGAQVRPHPLADHAAPSAALLASLGACILVTAKDAVKCEPHADPRIWVLDVEAQLDGDLLALIRPALPTCFERAPGES